MGLKKKLKKVIGGGDDSGNEPASQITYTPPPRAQDEAPPPMSPSRQAAGSVPGVDPLDAQIVYAPEPQTRQMAAPATMADKIMARAVPVDELTRERRIAPPTAPPVATATYGPKGQPLGAEGGADDLANNEAYLRALETYKPTDHNGRLKSAGIGAGRAYARGGGLIGAIAGLIHGAVDPGADERFANERAIATTTRAVGRGQASRTAQQKIENDQSEIEYRAAQAKRLANPVYRPQVVPTDEGPVQVDSNGLATPITYKPQGDQPGARVKAPAKPGTDKTQIRYKPDPTDPDHQIAEKVTVGADGKEKAALASPKDDVYKVNGRWSSGASANNYQALAGQREFQNNETLKRDDERKEDKAQTRIDKAGEHKVKIGKLTGAIDGYKQTRAQIEGKITQLQARLAAAKTPEEKQTVQDAMDGWDYQLQKAQAEATAAASELQNAYGDVFKAGVGEKGWVFYERQPLSRSTWRVKYKNASKSSEDAWAQNMQDLGFTVTK